jgi:hypothetical protein
VDFDIDTELAHRWWVETRVVRQHPLSATPRISNSHIGVRQASTGSSAAHLITNP